jgi:CheY-specific phosphatase CheX/predicted regulator of Ras-like GTPase activity (Roadblock/LC7/MglB family)
MEKITDDAIRKTIETTIIETFDAMMSMALEVATDTETDHLESGNAMVGAIHFGGEVVGVMSFRLTESMARKSTAAMLGIETAEIKSIEEVYDVIGELANIVAGNLKTEFLDVGLTCVISTPSITTGSDFKIDPVDIAPPVKFAFLHQDETVLVELCAKEEIGAKEDIMSDLSSDVNEQTLAAETSGKLNEIKKTLSLFDVGNLKRCILTGKEGSYLFSNIGNAFLVIIIRKNANIGYVQIEVERHLDELKEKMKL